MRSPRHALSIVAVVLLAGCGPKVPSVTLAVEKKLNATFSNVSNVVEIDGGRVAFADPLARRFHTGDFATGAVDTVGVPVDTLPVNAPASLYKRPGWVAQLGFDTVAVVDFGATRTTLWTPAGFARVLVIPEAGGVTPVLVYDTLGHGYKADFRTVTGGAEPGTQMRKDSLPVLRMNLASGVVDTVARLSVPGVRRGQVWSADPDGGPDLRPDGHLRRAAGWVDLGGACAHDVGGLAITRRHLDAWRGAQLCEGCGDR